MFGCTPGTFKILDAAEKAAKAFSLEEHTEWVVVKRDVENIRYYRTCRLEDLPEAYKEKWVLATFKSEEMYNDDKLTDESIKLQRINQILRQMYQRTVNLLKNEAKTLVYRYGIAPKDKTIEILKQAGEKKFVDEILKKLADDTV